MIALHTAILHTHIDRIEVRSFASVWEKLIFEYSCALPYRFIFIYAIYIVDEHITCKISSRQINVIAAHQRDREMTDSKIGQFG